MTQQQNRGLETHLRLESFCAFFFLLFFFTNFYYRYNTVPFHSIHQSRITGPQKSTKCHDGHGHFGEVMKSFLDSKKLFLKKRWPLTNFEKKKPLPDKILYLSHSSHPPDETIFSSGVSHVTVADKLILMVQYFCGNYNSHGNNTSNSMGGDSSSFFFTHFYTAIYFFKLMWFFLTFLPFDSSWETTFPTFCYLIMTWPAFFTHFYTS